jgi:hypothetical protein
MIFCPFEKKRRLRVGVVMEKRFPFNLFLVCRECLYKFSRTGWYLAI